MMASIRLLVLRLPGDTCTSCSQRGYPHRGGSTRGGLASTQSERICHAPTGPFDQIRTASQLDRRAYPEKITDFPFHLHNREGLMAFPHNRRAPRAHGAGNARKSIQHGGFAPDAPACHSPYLGLTTRDAVSNGTAVGRSTRRSPSSIRLARRRSPVLSRPRASQEDILCCLSGLNGCSVERLVSSTGQYKRRLLAGGNR
jgi:hypothetical protein